MRTLIAMLFVAISTMAHAHDYVTRDGRVITWYSGNGCCNDSDCRPIKERRGNTPAGDIIVVTDDDKVVIIPKTLGRKPSKDEGEHVCAKSIENGTVGDAHCHFVPTEVNMSKRRWLAALDVEILRNICKN